MTATDAYHSGENYLVEDPTIKVKRTHRYMIAFQVDLTLRVLFADCVQCTDEKYRQTNFVFVLPLAFIVPPVIPLWYYLSLSASKKNLVPPLPYPDDSDRSFQEMRLRVLLDYHVIITCL